MKRDQLSKGRRTAEWKGWNEQMPVQVVTSRGTEVFRNLSEARRKYPTLDPQRNTRDFTWAMRGSVSGRLAIRFEDWATEEIMSRAASLRIQAIKLAYENPGPVRDAILPLLTRTASSMGRVERIDWDNGKPTLRGFLLYREKSPASEVRLVSPVSRGSFLSGRDYLLLRVTGRSLEDAMKQMKKKVLEANPAIFSPVSKGEYEAGR